MAILTGMKLSDFRVGQIIYYTNPSGKKRYGKITEIDSVIRAHWADSPSEIQQTMLSEGIMPANECSILRRCLRDEIE